MCTYDCGERVVSKKKAANKIKLLKMLKLHVLENTELSTYCLNILEKHGITLIREFNTENPEKLMKILNLNFEQVKKIKDELRRLHGPKRYIASDRYNNINLNQTLYGTHIDNLDRMLAPKDLLSNLSFWEICGPTGVGKTQLALTLVLNFVTKQIKSVLYIDTKLDFSASRIKNMLEARKIEPELYGGIMSFIKVERVLSAQGVVEMLEEFYKQLQQESDAVSSIKMIVIDSLPAAWFLLKADINRLSGKWLLSRLSQIINLIVQKYYVAVICINLSLIPTPEEKNAEASVKNYNDNDISDLIENDDMEMGSEKSSYRPVLGNFWLSKPYVRLSLEFPDENSGAKYEDDGAIRVMKLISTRFSPNGLSCFVKLQPEGFV